MRKPNIRLSLPVATAILSIICIFVLMITMSFSVDGSMLSFRQASTYNEKWTIADAAEGDSVSTIPRLLTAQQGSLVIKNVLPEIESNDYTLCFRTNNEKIKVFVDGQPIYSYAHDDPGAYGSIWSVVKLTPEMSGKDIEIEFVALSDEIYNGNYVFYLDQINTVFITILFNNFPLIFCCLVGFILGILLLIAGMISIIGMRSGLNVTAPRLYLGMFTIVGQIWAIAQADLLQFVISNKAAAHLLTHSSLMLMPALFAMYFSALIPRRRKQYLSMASLFSSYLLLRLILHTLGILDIGQWLPLTHIVIFSGICFAVISSLICIGGVTNTIMYCGVILFFVLTVIGIGMYWLKPYLESDMPEYALLISIAVDMLLICFYFALLLNHIYLASNAKHFREQAYTDALTGVNNRAAFDSAAARLSADVRPALTLFMLDLNNLKQVNDTLGHPAGDNLIKALVNYIQTAFDGIGSIYRFGGDEFVVAAETASLGECMEAQDRFVKLIEEHSMRGGTEISVAIGMASRQHKPFDSLDAQELLHQADLAMYKSKEIMKSAPPTRRNSWQALGQMDEITGIQTFSSFKSCVYDALSTNSFSCPCIINFDVHFFDSYNQLFGWDAGNRILQKLAVMAMRICGDYGFCAHGAADSFWVFTDVRDIDELKVRITEETRRFQAELDDCMLFPSFGIYMIADRTMPVSDMCSRATSSKKRIKGRLDNLYAMYDADEQQRRTENMKLLSYMHKAMKGDEFVPYYQPKYSRDGKKIVGAETLVRWSDNPGKNATTEEFTALFEQSGLILTLDWYMLEKTCEMLRDFIDSGIACVPVTVNFSNLHVYEPDCIEHIGQIIERFGIPSSLIGIELIKTSLHQDTEKIKQFTAGLRQAGISVTMDDFESTPHSLTLLSELNIDVISIRYSMIEEASRSEAVGSIYNFMLELCRKLDIKVLIEGIERLEQFEILSQHRCDLVQGNLFSHPVPMHKFKKLLQQRRKDG